MSEKRLQMLERQWFETASLEDEVQYLAYRIRLGLVSEEDLKTASKYGSLAAKEVLGPGYLEKVSNFHGSLKERFAQALEKAAVTLTRFRLPFVQNIARPEPYPQINPQILASICVIQSNALKTASISTLLYI